jgi:hypothetical protein
VALNAWMLILMYIYYFVIAVCALWIFSFKKIDGFHLCAVILYNTRDLICINHSRSYFKTNYLILYCGNYQNSHGVIFACLRLHSNVSTSELTREYLIKMPGGSLRLNYIMIVSFHYRNVGPCCSKRHALAQRPPSNISCRDTDLFILVAWIRRVCDDNQWSEVHLVYSVYRKHANRYTYKCPCIFPSDVKWRVLIRSQRIQNGAANEWSCARSSVGRHGSFYRGRG